MCTCVMILKPWLGHTCGDVSTPNPCSNKRCIVAYYQTSLHQVLHRKNPHFIWFIRTGRTGSDCLIYSCKKRIHIWI